MKAQLIIINCDYHSYFYYYKILLKLTFNSL